MPAGAVLSPRQLLPMDEFHRCLATEPVLKVLAWYRNEGGNPQDLKRLLLRLWVWKYNDVTPVPPRFLDARLAAFIRASGDLLRIPNLPDRLGRATRQALQEALRWKATEVFKGQKGKAGSQTGRPGPSFPSLVAAVLAYEFTNRLDSPCYNKILTLIQAVAPEEFSIPASTPPVERLRKRVKSVLKEHEDLARDWHTEFFS